MEGLYSNGTSRNLGGGMSNGAAWKSSATNIAIVSNNGNAHCVTEGTGTITATYMTFSDLGTITCTAAIVARIQVTPLYATWISLNKTAAIVSNADGSRGLTTALSVSTAFIEANFQGQKGAATLPVAIL